MLVLFETSAGYALFKVLDEGKLSKPDDIWQHFQTADSAQKIVALQKFSKFDSITDAMSGATAVVESKLSKGLRKFLQKTIVDKEISDKLAVADAKLGGLIKNKLGINCVHDNAAINELMRGIRTQIENLIEGITSQDMKAMSLGLSHSLGRYKLKFSPDKVDIMIVQAISLLDDLDKELNTYAMRAREWYGWHFPELGKIIPENVLFAKTVQALGFRTNAATTDLTTVLPEEMAKDVKDAAQISMGTEVSEEDINNITDLCVQVIAIAEYRDQLYDYLKNRMQAIAPNLTVLVGEIVGARLIAKAGNLMNLAKYPASTVQILGAEKALFRALKTKHETPKYGLIYHASLIGQAGPKNKGKISRLLAAKASLSARVDALGDKDTQEVGTENRAKVESRIRQLEGKALHGISGQGKSKARAEKYDNKRSPAAPTQVRESASYNAAGDATIADGKKKREAKSGEETPAKKSRKEKAPVEDVPVEDAPAEEEEAPKKEKKAKKDKKSKKGGDDE